MESAYSLEPWQNLYVMLGGSAAALIGLIFVVISLQIEVIVNNPRLRARASVNTFMIVILLINSIAILTPQDIVTLGIELCLTALLYFPFFIWHIMRVWHVQRQIPMRALTSTFFPLIGIAGAVSLILRSGGGMYIVTVQSAAILAWAIFNSWSLMQAAAKGERAKA